MEKGITREEKIVARIAPFLKTSQKIIDIGCGKGGVTKLLREKGKKVKAVDVINFCYSRKISDVIIYDGQKLPFKDNSFDASLLITVMHHTPRPETIFSEAARVSREIIVMETTYKNLWQKIYTVFIDTVVNLQPRFFWHSYRLEEEWGNFFRPRGFKIASKKLYSDRIFLLPFLHVVYYLKKEN